MNDDAVKILLFFGGMIWFLVSTVLFFHAISEAEYEDAICAWFWPLFALKVVLRRLWKK